MHAPRATDGLIADAVAACASVRAAAFVLHAPAEQKLRAIREAGRLLSLVQRCDGGRPLNNSSRGLTSYQSALKQAGITRQTACAWRRVAAVPESDFEQFIADARLSMGDLTIAELLRASSPRSETPSPGRTVTLHLSVTEYRMFQQQVGVLSTAYATGTVTQTVVAVLAHAYRGWLAGHTSRPCASDGIVLTPLLSTPRPARDAHAPAEPCAQRLLSAPQR